MKEITRNPDVMWGQYVISGTRIPVTAINNFARRNYSAQEIQREYPSLSIAQINAAIAFRKVPTPTDVSNKP